MKSARLLGAERIIAIDTVPERLAMAVEQSQAETIDFEKEDVYERLMEMTNGRGPDRCIDSVGCEAHGGGTLDGTVDSIKTSVFLATDRPHVLRQAIWSCRKGGTVSVPGVYIGFGDKIPLGALMNKGITIRTGQTHVKRYLPKLMDHIQKGDIDPSFVITHKMKLEDAPKGYEMFKNHDEGCIKIVLNP
jgi:threonine dehydrogenase-like Zn-dependent dehydrogenase